MNKLFDIQFVGLTPVENTGQATWAGETSEGAYEAFINYLTGVYGPNGFKVTLFKEAEGIDPEHDPFPIPNNPPTSKVLN